MAFTEMFQSLALNLFAKLQPVAKSMIEDDQDLLRIIDFWEGLKTKDHKTLLTNNRNENGT